MSVSVVQRPLGHQFPVLLRDENTHTTRSRTAGLKHYTRVQSQNPTGKRKVFKNYWIFSQVDHPQKSSSHIQKRVTPREDNTACAEIKWSCRPSIAARTAFDNGTFPLKEEGTFMSTTSHFLKQGCGEVDLEAAGKRGASLPS